MKKTCFIILGICCACFANAQNQATVVLNESIAKIHHLKSIRYEVKAVEKNPFSDGDTSFINRKTVLAFDKNGLLKAMNKETNINHGQNRLKEIFVKDTLYSVSLKDSLYSFDIKKPENISNDLGSFIHLVNHVLSKSSKIIQHQDTTIDHIACYNFFIKSYDTIVNNNHNYTYQTLLINKANLMPVFTKEIGVGEMEKGGYALGRLHIYNEVHFYNLKLNEKVDDSVFRFEKKGFDVYNDKMLANGVIAPDIQVADLSNHLVNASKFKNKILLIEFGSTTCGANPLANPMLNRLNQKYASKDFEIVSIYSEEPSDLIKKYIKTNNLDFPIYLGNKNVKRDFKTVGTPDFYLIDRSGKIIQSSNGYNDDLEKDFSKKIEEMIQR